MPPSSSCYDTPLLITLLPTLALLACDPGGVIDVPDEAAAADSVPPVDTEPPEDTDTATTTADTETTDDSAAPVDTDDGPDQLDPPGLLDIAFDPPGGGFTGTLALTLTADDPDAHCTFYYNHFVECLDNCVRTSFTLRCPISLVFSQRLSSLSIFSLSASLAR